MPEGHTLHRLARAQRARFAGRAVHVSSPQGRFTDAALVDGRVLDTVSAHGKHLFAAFGDRIVHVHLGLFGKVAAGDGQPPPPSVRCACAGSPTRVERPARSDGVRGAQPVGGRRHPRPSRPRSPRASARRRPRLRPHRPQPGARRRPADGPGRRGRDRQRVPGGDPLPAPHRPLPARARPRRVPLEPALERPRAPHARRAALRSHRHHGSGRSRPALGGGRREDAHYVYRRTGLPCRICGTPVAMQELSARKLYWCPVCQAA